VRIDGERYNPVPILKFTTGSNFRIGTLNKPQQELLALLQKEATTNNFKIMINKNIL